MIVAPILLLAGAGAVPAVPLPPPSRSGPVDLPAVDLQPVTNWQLVIEQRLTIRVPARRTPLVNFSASPEASPRTAPQPITWKEKKAPKCLAMKSVVGMQVQRDSIDILTRQNQRIRALLNRGCRPLDFYSGFYMQANKDGQLCADRDLIHARSGAECEIDKFRLMVPVRRDD